VRCCAVSTAIIGCGEHDGTSSMPVRALLLWRRLGEKSPRPCANPWGHNNPLSPCISRPMKLRWAPCRKLNWERDALAALPFAPFGGMRLRVVVAHINCVSYITARVECALFKIPFISSTTKSTPLVSIILSYCYIHPTLVHLLLSIFS
jgi:hypothetical protein